MVQECAPTPRVLCLMAMCSSLTLTACMGNNALPGSGNGDNPGAGPLPMGSDSGGADNQCRLNDRERALLARVNEARTRTRQCGAERYPAVEPVRWSCRLEDAAQEHALDMAETNFFSHTGSDGSTAADRVDAQGYAWSAVGENIAAGNVGMGQVVEGWLESPSHCANLMNEQFTEMGIASAESRNGDFSTYWVQVFARPLR